MKNNPLLINNDLMLLNDDFRIKVRNLINNAFVAGLDIYVFEGRRSKDRQYMLFGKGRSVVTLKKYGVPIEYADPKAKQVTWTLDSKHLQGKAVDIVFDLDKDPKKHKPSWSGNRVKIVEIAKQCGLYSLAPKELCHFQD